MGTGSLEAEGASCPRTTRRPQATALEFRSYLHTMYLVWFLFCFPSLYAQEQVRPPSDRSACVFDQRSSRMCRHCCRCIVCNVYHQPFEGGWSSADFLVEFSGQVLQLTTCFVPIAYWHTTGEPDETAGRIVMAAQMAAILITIIVGLPPLAVNVRKLWKDDTRKEERQRKLRKREVKRTLIQMITALEAGSKEKYLAEINQHAQELKELEDIFSEETNECLFRNEE